MSTRARTALFSLDAACSRDKWVRVAMAAKATGLLESDFVEWSARAGAAYGGEREAKTVWRSVKAEGGVTAATLYALANEQSAGATSGRTRTRVRPSLHTPPHSNGAAALVAMFDAYPPAPVGHKYIETKRGSPDGLKVVPAGSKLAVAGQQVSGWLAVPARSFDGALRAIQFIPPPGTGKKLNAPGSNFGDDAAFVVGCLRDECTVYVCEGIGQAWACARADHHAAAVVTFGAGRTRAVATMLRKRLPDARLVIVSDRGKEGDAEALARDVKGAWVEMPAIKPSNYDANDYEAEHGPEALADLLRAAKTPPMRYRLQSAADLANAPSQRWMVQGVLPASGFAAVYGPSGSGKSFLVLDLCAAIADGIEWFGRRVCAAPVTCVCLEGEAGLGKRVKAWSIRQQRNLPDRLRFVTQPLDLRQPEAIADLCAAVLAAGGRDGLLVIDTLNRAAPGMDENSSSDMGELIAACNELQRTVGGVVMVVHHTGKDGAKGLRGHSSLLAALDAAIEVSRSDAKRRWSIAKSKDDVDGALSEFHLRTVELGRDEYGDPVTSCVVVAEAVSANTRRAVVPRGGNQRVAFDALTGPFDASTDVGMGGAPSDARCLAITKAVELLAQRLTCDAKHRTQRAREAIAGLIKLGIYGGDERWLWLN